ncbi:hypothetical protein [Yinghuangia soli]|uniref:Uncharacterized protein n=1 Tax=Yinghuangia soli TaxID=2908204 RepID=A0AA41U2P1_9ACTN|nr:hypothetical protein [Yinghuangia soli]MCF2530895.1 hypothetical protein [Yinghuangia soli]
MADETENAAGPRSFLTCATEVARLMDVEDVADLAAKPDNPARHLAHAVRKPLLERASLPEELFAPLMAASVYDPDPSFCLWFVEPAVYAFGRRRVAEALLDYLRDGTDAERAGAERAWYWTHAPLRRGRSAAYESGTVRDPALDRLGDIADAWLEASLRVLVETADLQLIWRLARSLPDSRSAYPPALRELLETTIASARVHSDPYIKDWAAAMDRDRS